MGNITILYREKLQTQSISKNKIQTNRYFTARLLVMLCNDYNAERRAITLIFSNTITSSHCRTLDDRCIDRYVLQFYELNIMAQHTPK